MTALAALAALLLAIGFGYVFGIVFRWALAHQRQTRRAAHARAKSRKAQDRVKPATVTRHGGQAMSETRYTPEQMREMAAYLSINADPAAAMLRQAATDAEALAGAVEVNRILNEICGKNAEALAAKDWQDISTAPKDGSYVLISGREWDKAEPEIHKACWGFNSNTLSEPRHLQEAWCIANSMDRDYHIDDEVEFPTHWMPLPELP